jgi:curved DNA-binding protein CbpA
MQRVPDPYRTLGVDRDATAAEVKAAHRRLAKRYHPDAPHADATRFLAVQDAYELLRDPLSRREWDRRHAPGPVRAQPGTTGTRRRGPATNGDRTGAETPASTGRRRRRSAGVDDTFGPNDRPPQSDSWTWTAEGVPWWEDSGAPRSRRTARRRPAAGPAQRQGTPSGSRGDRSTASDPGPPPPGATAPAPPGAAETRPESDVYSRSSGAAWSSASRAYFRRRAADMPSGAANPNTPRWTTPAGAPMPRRYETTASASTGDRGRDTPPDPDTPHPPPGSTSASRPGGSSRRLGAALAAIFRRGDR